MRRSLRHRLAGGLRAHLRTGCTGDVLAKRAGTFLLGVCVCLTACGSGSSGTPAKAGSYGGTTSQGEGIGLVVASGAHSLSSLAIRAKYSCPLQGKAEDTAYRGPSGSVPVKGGSFDESFTSNATTYKISGTYKGGAFSGTLSASFPAELGSGNCTSGNVSWHATLGSPPPSGAPSSPGASASSSAARQQLDAAANSYNTGAATFNSKTSADAHAGNLRAFKSDAAGFRTVIAQFDAAVRRISFPASAGTQVSALLGADRRELADLDAVRAATGANSAVRLYNSAIADTRTVIAAEQALYDAS